MRKCLKSVLILVAVCLLTATLSLGAMAAGSVTYTGNSGDFIFAPGSNANPTDLFENFKDVMPGDVLTETVEIKNNADDKVDVEIFLKSLGAYEGSEDLLEKMNITVKVVGGDTLQDSNAAVGGDLADFVSLGKFPSGSTTTLEVTLTVPAELGNDYQDRLAELQWQFKVEEKPVEVPVKTSDNSMLPVYGAAFVAALALGVILVVMKRKNRA